MHCIAETERVTVVKHLATIDDVIATVIAILDFLLVHKGDFRPDGPAPVDPVGPVSVTVN